MSEMKKCPCCDSQLMYMIPRIGTPAGYVCTSAGCLFRCNVEHYEKFCAAMELARLEYSFDACKSEDEHKYQELIALARKQVVEVFK